ncbi:hypothetical protein [Streptomyces sp. NPDC127190]|uniref:hypothetical protein n=1 Tax=unclassified Streptomyces TaxID=2593676 RepID=UPI003643C25F
MAPGLLASEYRRIVELVQAKPGDGERVSAKELAARLDLPLVPAKIEGARSRAKRLVERGSLVASPSGRFMRRASSGPVRGVDRAGQTSGHEHARREADERLAAGGQRLEVTHQAP